MSLQAAFSGSGRNNGNDRALAAFNGKSKSRPARRSQSDGLALRWKSTPPQLRHSPRPDFNCSPMATDIETLALKGEICDTHEHLFSNENWLKQKPDILREIISWYLIADFVSAGATQAQMDALMDARDPDVRARFESVAPIWRHVQHTGYGEAARIAARTFFGIDEIDADSLAAAQTRLPEAWAPDDRYRVMRETGRLHHTQTDDFKWACAADPSGPEFFFTDLSMASFCSGAPDWEAVQKETGVEVKDLETLRQTLAALFEKYGPWAIAIKSQHAYNRTLRWAEPDEADVQALLRRSVAGESLAQAEKERLGDWCIDRVCEFAVAYNLPFKIHTGYYAGNHRMPVDRIRPGHLCPLLARHPDTRFVLMHIGYPYWEEMIALAKHYRNAWVDLCWAWAVNPRASGQFLRSYLRAAPINKLFAFGGDTAHPRMAVAFAIQARQGLARALQAEVDEGLLTEPQALEILRRLLAENALDCFDHAGRAARSRKAVA